MNVNNISVSSANIEEDMASNFHHLVNHQHHPIITSTNLNLLDNTVNSSSSSSSATYNNVTPDSILLTSNDIYSLSNLYHHHNHHHLQNDSYEQTNLPSINMIGIQNNNNNYTITNQSHQSNILRINSINSPTPSPTSSSTSSSSPSSSSISNDNFLHQNLLLTNKQTNYINNDYEIINNNNNNMGCLIYTGRELKCKFLQ